MAATITHGGTLPDSSAKADFYALIDNATITGITGAELSKIDTASKISGKAFTELANIPAGAGEIPAANLPASTSSADDMIARGFEIAPYAVDATAIIINAGVLNHGSTKISKTSNTTLTFATAADWWDGAADTYAGGAGWCYVGADVSGNIKLLGANPPDKADSAGNTDGTKYYWYDGSLYWRVIGAIRVDTDDKVGLEMHQTGNFVAMDVANFTFNSAAFTDISLAAYVPAISRLVSMGVDENSQGTVYIRPNGSAFATGIYCGILSQSLVIGLVMTDATQVVEAKNSGAGNSHLKLVGYYLNIR